MLGKFLAFVVAGLMGVLVFVGLSALYGWFVQLLMNF